MLASALAMSSCVNDAEVDYNNEVPGNGSEQVAGNGNVRFIFSLNNSASAGRDAEDSGVHEQGNSEEYKLHNVQLYFFDTTSGLFKEKVDVGDLALVSETEADLTVKYSGTATVKKGSYNIYAVANTRQVINAAMEDDFLAHVEQVSGIVNGITDSGIVMTNRGAENQGVLLEPTTNGSAVTVNISLERVLAKIELSNTKDSYELRDNAGNLYATINLNNFKIVNLSKQYYTFRHVDVIPDGTETPATEPTYQLPDNCSLTLLVDYFKPYF